MDSFWDDDEEEDGGSRYLDMDQIAEPDVVSDHLGYDVWVNSPQSVRERRRKFIGLMGLGPRVFEGEISVDTHDNGVPNGDNDRIVENNGAVLRTTSIEDDLSSSGSSMSSWNTDDLDLYQGTGQKNITGNTSYAGDFEMVENKKPQKIQVKEQDDFQPQGKLGDVLEVSPFVQQFKHREVEASGYTPRTMDRLKQIWLRKLRSLTCVDIGDGRADHEGLDGSCQACSGKIRRVGVHHSHRKLKELSALFTGQDIQAHEGSILAMKFSPNGQYLASAGEDKIVKVWKVVEDERLDAVDIPDADPSCVFLSLNNLSELRPLTVETDNKVNKPKNLRKTPDSACVIIPPKVFRILEKPLHIFHGHTEEILDLSWSSNNSLLSSSMDKTVQLWRVGHDQCLKVFYHTDYVTCIQFHPVSDDYFISGSIDGKVRIWTITDCQVIYWAETRDIITAVSYWSNGQGGIIGFITGTYRIFNISGALTLYVA